MKHISSLRHHWQKYYNKNEFMYCYNDEKTIHYINIPAMFAKEFEIVDEGNFVVCIALKPLTKPRRRQKLESFIWTGIKSLVL